MTENHLHFCY